MSALGQRLRQAREEIRPDKPKLSQAALGKMVNMSGQAVGLIERGETQDPRKLVQLAKALKLNPNWLVTGKEPKYSDDWEQIVNLAGLPEEAQAGILNLVSSLEEGRLSVKQFLGLLALILDK
ncbi:helix-turn-helix domain-containing protein [Thiocystis violacea]|uniref:helix-turn-helix domain-containing protein n=1 Tax=Thiocystis violacea TaxID=13725 RepID=UPI0019065B4F|nr:helix-turn-helix domain-containing protein [Thiocystis violacea]MBK1719193.1 hypothetical protein [Thiocystis violacea]